MSKQKKTFTSNKCILRDPKGVFVFVFFTRGEESNKEYWLNEELSIEVE